MMEVALRDAKTARLREARLAKEAADLLAHAPGKPRAKAVKAVIGRASTPSGSVVIATSLNVNSHTSMKEGRPSP